MALISNLINPLPKEFDETHTGNIQALGYTSKEDIASYNEPLMEATARKPSTQNIANKLIECSRG